MVTQDDWEANCEAATQNGSTETSPEREAVEFGIFPTRPHGWNFSPLRMAKGFGVRRVQVPALPPVNCLICASHLTSLSLTVPIWELGTVILAPPPYCGERDELGHCRWMAPGRGQEGLFGKREVGSGTYADWQRRAETEKEK